MNTIPQDLYSNVNFFTETKGSQQYFLSVEKDNKDEETLVCVEKKSLGLIKRIFIWLGIYPSSIKKVSELFLKIINDNSLNNHVATLIANDTGADALGNKNYEKIQTLANNLINFTKKVEAHDKNVGRFSLRKKALTEENSLKIGDFAKKLLLIKRPPPPAPKALTPAKPKGLRTRVWSAMGKAPVVGRFVTLVDRFWPGAKPVETTIDPSASDEPSTSTTSVATIGPQALPHLGNTCHLASSMCYLSVLKPLLNALASAKYTPDRGADQATIKSLKEKAELRDAVLKVLNYQGKMQSSPITRSDFQKVVELFEAAGRNPHDHQDPHEDIVFILSLFDKNFEDRSIPKEADLKISLEMTQTLSVKPIKIYKPIAKEEYERTMKAISDNGGKLPTLIDDGLSSEKLMNMEPVFNTSCKPHQESLFEIPVSNFKNKWNPTLNDALNQMYFQTSDRGDQEVRYVKERNSDQYRKIDVQPQGSMKMQNAPEVLMIHYKCYETNKVNNSVSVAKISNPIKTPMNLTLPGAKPQKYELVSCTSHSGSISGGHHIAMQKINGVWYKNNDLGGVTQLTDQKASWMINSGSCQLASYQKVN